MSVFVSQEVTTACLQRTGDSLALFVYLQLIKFNVEVTHLFRSSLTAPKLRQKTMAYLALVDNKKAETSLPLI